MINSAILEELAFFMNQKKAVIFILTIAAFFSCSTPNEIPSIEKHYRLDLKIENVGNHYKGIAVLVDKPLYTLNLESTGKMDYLSFNSCSTTITSQDAGGVFNRKKTKINFRPNEIEKEENCLVKIDITNKKLKHTFGLVLFESDLFQQKATVVCGSVTRSFNGVAGCQILAGNRYRIRFDEMAVAFSECEIKEKGKVFDMVAKPGICNYYFSSKGKKFKLLVYGWTEELLND